MIVKGIANALSPAGPGARLSILIFHRVLSQPDALLASEPDIRRFNEVIGWVSHWFNVLPLDRAVAQLRGGTLPPRAAAITFDDGYADNASNALPVLQHHRVSATFFISTGFLDGGRMWNDSIIEAVRRCDHSTLDLQPLGLGLHPMGSVAQRRDAIDHLLGGIKYMEPGRRRETVNHIVQMAGARLPDDLMLRSRQIRALRDAGMQIGAHTVTHPILETLTDVQAQQEISSSKTALESLLEEPVHLFAYPNGKPGVDYSAKHVAMVRSAGYCAAVSTAPGAAMSVGDAHQLPRFTPWDRTRSRYGMRMLANLRTSATRTA